MAKKRKKAPHAKKRPRKILLHPERHTRRGDEFVRFASRRIAGQPRFLEYGARVIDKTQKKTRRRKRPLAVLLLLGSAGSGKTLLAQVVAEFLYDDPDAMLRLDGQDYAEKHKVEKLLHPPRGYSGWEEEPLLTQDKLERHARHIDSKRFRDALPDEGKKRYDELYAEYGKLFYRQQKFFVAASRTKDEKKRAQFSEEIEKNQRRAAEIYDEVRAMGYDPENTPFLSVLLVDEIERSHTSFRNILFKIMDEGKLENSLGDVISFENTVIVITSNLGSEEIARRLRVRSGEKTELGFVGQSEGSVEETGNEDLAMYQFCRKEAQGFFGAPFFRRVDAVLYARPHTKESLCEVLEIQIRSLRAHYDATFPIFIAIPDDVKAFVVEESLDHLEEGASILIKKFEKYIEDPIDRMCITGEITEGDVVDVSLCREDGKPYLKFQKLPPHTENREKKLVFPPDFQNPPDDSD